MDITLKLRKTAANKTNSIGKYINIDIDNLSMPMAVIDSINAEDDIIYLSPDGTPSADLWYDRDLSNLVIQNLKAGNLVLNVFGATDKITVYDDTNARDALRAYSTGVLELYAGATAQAINADYEGLCSIDPIGAGPIPMGKTPAGDQAMVSPFWKPVHLTVYPVVYNDTKSLKIVGSDKTSLLRKGDRLYVWHGANKYFYICVNSALVGSDTIFTVTGGSDYALQNAAITKLFISSHPSPRLPGNVASIWPGWFSWAPIFANFINNEQPTGVICRFMVTKNYCNLIVLLPNQMPHTVNTTAPTATLPIEALNDNIGYYSYITNGSASYIPGSLPISGILMTFYDSYNGEDKAFGFVSYEI